MEQQKKLTDCYWFLQNQCKKGEACEYRHSEGALENTAVCKFWVEGKCVNDDCSFRHPSGVQVSKDRSQTPCFYFTQGKCTKGDSCPFAHSNAAAQPDLEMETKKRKEEEELRKLQIARKREEDRVMRLKAQGEELQKRNELKRKKDEQFQQRPAKQDKRIATEKPAQEKGAGVGTFVKSLDQIFKEERPKTRVVKQKITPEVGESQPKFTVADGAKPQPKKKVVAQATKAQPKQKVASEVAKPQPKIVADKKVPAKKAAVEKQQKPQEPAGPMNFGIKTLDQILKEKAPVSEITPKEQSADPMDVVVQRDAVVQKDSDSSNASYLSELRKKNQRKFGLSPTSSGPRADTSQDGGSVLTSEIPQKIKEDTSPKRKLTEEPKAQKSETKKPKLEHPRVTAVAASLKKSSSVDDFDKEFDKDQANPEADNDEEVGEEDFDTVFNELQDLIK